MSERDQDANGNKDWLGHSILSIQQTLHTVMEKVGSIQATQHGNRETLIERTDMLADHFSERLSDLKNEIFPRLEKLETVRTESMVTSVIGWLMERIPWHHLIYLVPGFLLGLIGHMFPERMAAALKALLVP